MTVSKRAYPALLQAELSAEMVDEIVASVKTSTSKELNNRCDARLVLVFGEFRRLRGEAQTGIFVK